MTSKSIYSGQLRVESTHIKSGELIVSDAPVDNKGKGAAFSPTDLLATSLASCMLTIMGIVAEDKNINIMGAYTEVTKIMDSGPRRVSAIEINVFMPDLNLSSEVRELLENAAGNCPVAKSIHPDIEQIIVFSW
jgi:putative redox protein